MKPTKCIYKNFEHSLLEKEMVATLGLMEQKMRDGYLSSKDIFKWLDSLTEEELKQAKWQNNQVCDQSFILYDLIFFYKRKNYGTHSRGIKANNED